MSYKHELKPCIRCGGKLRAVNSNDGTICAIYCDECKKLYMLNDVYGGVEATIDHYNRKFDDYPQWIRLVEGGGLMAELKPCPFCGGEAEVWSHYYDELDMRLWQVRCMKRPYEAENACYASESFISFETEEEAIEAWNTRAERTCTVRNPRKYLQECSLCGGAVIASDNYCPKCGSKVIRNAD